MNRYFLWCMIFLFLAGFKLNAQEPVKSEKLPVLEQLLGEWDAWQVKKNRNGQWSGDTTYSRWHWYIILNGDVIQDDWIKITQNQNSEVTSYIAGRNIRIYNKAEKQWYMTWIGRNAQKLVWFNALNKNNTVIMNGKNVNGREIHNTFFNISSDSFDWKQEWTFDNGLTWIEVTRIHCKRRS